MGSDRSKRKMSAILSADVKGYSLLMSQDEKATIRTLKEYKSIIAKCVKKAQGRVVDSPGDNMLAEFGSVVDAVQCALEAQEELKQQNSELPEPNRMAFRMGVNLGDVIEDRRRIYGDGVNIAARIEGLAEAGGVCISGTAYDHVKNKLAADFEYLGEQTVKNMPEPIRAYRVTAQDDASSGMPVEVEVGEKPSIAILPFVNMSGDAEQDYFSDGLTEDLITDLSKMGALFVIARNSVFTYKGRAVKVQQIGRELGVRYVVEGSVRRAGDRVRVTAQLVDASTGGHIWAERYDRELKDIFDLQDELTRQIVGALRVKVIEMEQTRVLHKDTGSLNAFECVLRGRYHSHQFTREGSLQARAFYEKAIELDPRYAPAYAGLGFCYFSEWSNQWNDDASALDKALELGEKAVGLDDTLAVAHSLLGHAYLWKKQFEQAVREEQRAIALNPTDADNFANYAEVLVWVGGRAEEAVEMVKKAMRLNPLYPVHYLYTLGYAYILQGKAEESIATLKKAIDWNPEFVGSRMLLAAAYSEIERMDEAQFQVREILRVNPGMSLDIWKERLPFRNDATLTHFTDALARAGLK